MIFTMKNLISCKIFHIFSRRSITISNDPEDSKRILETIETHSTALDSIEVATVYKDSYGTYLAVIENSDELSRIAKGDRIIKINNIDLTNLKSFKAPETVLKAARSISEVVQLVISKKGTLPQPWDLKPILIEVDLNRGTKGLGFTIAGGIGNEHIPGDNRIYVTNVIKGGIAYIDGRIIAGDRLVAIKNMPNTGKDFYLDNCTHDEAANAFKLCKDKLVLIVAKTPTIVNPLSQNEVDSNSDFEHVEKEDSIKFGIETIEYGTNKCESSLSEYNSDENIRDESENVDESDKCDEEPGLDVEEILDYPGSGIQNMEPKRSKAYIFLDSLSSIFKAIFMLFICVLLVQYFCTQFEYHNPEDLEMIKDLEQRLDNLKESNDHLEKVEELRVQEIFKFIHQHTDLEAKIKNLQEEIWAYQEKESNYIIFIENLQNSVSKAYAQMIN